MVLKGVQLLLVAMTSLEQRLIALSDGLKLTGECLQLVVVVNESALSATHLAVILGGATTLGVLLTYQLSLGFEQETVTLVRIVAVFLESLHFVLIPQVFGTGDLKLGAGVLVLHSLVVQSVVQTADLLIQTVDLLSLGVRVRHRGEVLSFLLLQLGSELEDLLVLLALGLVVDGKLPFCVFDVVFREATLVL